MNGLLFSQLKCIAVTRENDIFIRWLENDTFVRWLCTDLTDIRVQYKNLEKLSKQTIIYTIKTYLLKIALFNWFVNQPVSTVFFSYQISISHQPANNQQYFSLTTNQHQLPATANQLPTFTLFIGTYIATFLQITLKYLTMAVRVEMRSYWISFAVCNSRTRQSISFNTWQSCNSD